MCFRENKHRHLSMNVVYCIIVVFITFRWQFTRSAHQREQLYHQFLTKPDDPASFLHSSNDNMVSQNLQKSAIFRKALLFAWKAKINIFGIFLDIKSWKDRMRIFFQKCWFLALEVIMQPKLHEFSLNFFSNFSPRQRRR